MLLHCVALLLKGGRRKERSGGKRHILNYSLKWVKANLMEDENCVHLLFTKSFFNLYKGLALSDQPVSPGVISSS